MHYSILQREFNSNIYSIAQEYLPSKHKFFDNLKHHGSNLANSPELLGKFYHYYQSAMHATRVMVYYIPGLDSPELRKRKLSIFIDDDGLKNGDTHHHQLFRAFQRMGTKFIFPEEIYGSLNQVVETLDTENMRSLIRSVQRLYPESLGAWCIVEFISNDWMNALCNGLTKFFPQLSKEQYFHDCFKEHVEERHGAEALELALNSITNNKYYKDVMLIHAREMAKNLNLLWDSLDNVICNPC